MNRLKVLFLMFALPLFFACNSDPKPVEEPVKKAEPQVVEETVVEPTEQVDEKPVVEMSNDSDLVIYFAPESHTIDSYTARKLDVIAEKLQAEDVKQIVVVGHSAKLNTEQAEDWISLQRAEAVAEYFQTLGIFDADSIEIKGNGGTTPAGSHAEISERPNNRRVEIKY